MKNSISRKMKVALWNRLTARPEALNLDSRINEEPLDYFVRLAGSGKRDEVVAPLRALLVQLVSGEQPTDTEDALRFAQQALPLCDSLGAVECKPVLKNILLQEDSDIWAGHLEEVQELAARALAGLRKSAPDLRFWSDIAQKLNTCLPYALNAAIEIELSAGIQLVCEAHFTCANRGQSDLVDWPTVFYLAINRYGVAEVRGALREACEQYPNSPVLHEYMALKVAEAPSLSRRGKMQLDEILTPTRSPELVARSQAAALDLAESYDAFFGARVRTIRPEGISELVEMYKRRLPETAKVPTWLSYQPVSEA